MKKTYCWIAVFLLVATCCQSSPVLKEAERHLVEQPSSIIHRDFISNNDPSGLIFRRSAGGHPSFKLVEVDAPTPMDWKAAWNGIKWVTGMSSKSKSESKDVKQKSTQVDSKASRIPIDSSKLVQQGNQRKDSKPTKALEVEMQDFSNH